MQGWGKIKAAAEYAGIKERTMRNWLKSGLRHSRIPKGTILIKYEWIDEYLEAFAERENRVDQIVKETMSALPFKSFGRMK
jgi:predicted site-specific integrase-resolvase